MLTQSELKKLLHYNPETGVFTWLVAPARNVKVGYVAGSVDRKGYIRIVINGRRHQSHRLAWLYVHGQFPPNDIDHKNQIKGDNRWRNLRLATNSENQKNVGLRSDNTSGHKGVHKHKDSGKWVAQCWIGGKPHYLGCFDDMAEASAVREAFAKQHHGEFYCGHESSHARPLIMEVSPF